MNRARMATACDTDRASTRPRLRECRQRRCLAGLCRGDRCQPFLKPASQERDAGEMLSEAIMQVMSDASLLGVADFDDALLKFVCFLCAGFGADAR